MVEVQGHCHEAFGAVRAAFEQNFGDAGDVGASAAVTVEGEVVVDLWAGTGTPVGGGSDVAWQRDTIINVYSTTKTMAALTVLLLADRGVLDLDAPVARYWPEFAVNGKDGVLVRHVLGHTAGLPGWDEPLAPEDLFDHDRVAGLLAVQAPWWEPGTASGYHAITQGFLEGELVRRVTGETLGTVFARELAGPLGADFHIGTAPEHDARVVRVIPPSEGLDAAGLPPESVAVRAVGNPRLAAQLSWTEAWRRAEIPAANGHGHARSVAQVQAVVANGGTVGGRTFVSAGTLDRIFDEQAFGTDLVLRLPLRLGIGYGLVSEVTPLSTSERACFWGGWGGSLVVVDCDRRMTVAYVMNKMGEGTVGDLRGASVALAAGACATALT
jgi:CubicO group peptidase (beta-lactamase class C family)